MSCYYLNNRKKIINYQQKYTQKRVKNGYDLKKYQREYYIKNRDRILEYHRNIRLNKISTKPKKKVNKYFSIKRGHFILNFE